jgi:hypothetical protein
LRRAISAGEKSRVPLGIEGFCAISWILIPQSYAIMLKNEKIQATGVAISEKMPTFVVG